MNRNDVIYHLQLIRTWAAVGKDPIYRGIEPKCCEDVEKWIDDVIAMLKEQEWQTKRLTPTEPNVSINAYGVKFYYCPHCKRPILKSGIIGRPRHCEDCGQAVKWE